MVVGCDLASLIFESETAKMQRQRLALAPKRLLLAAQLLGTVAALGWVPTNAAKLIAVVTIWRLGFGRVSPAELASMTLVNLFLFWQTRRPWPGASLALTIPIFWGCRSTSI